MTDYHIAQCNIAELIAPKGDPQVEEFFARINEINALAERTPGFIWRLKDEEGDATSINVYNNDMLIVNMSVWESVEALYQYAYYSDHVELFRKRREWFHKMDRAYMALWWTPVGHFPSTDEMKQRLEYLNTHGPTPYAFTFKQQFTVEDLLATSKE